MTRIDDQLDAINRAIANKEESKSPSAVPSIPDPITDAEVKIVLI